MSSSSSRLTLRRLACWLQVVLLGLGMVQPVSGSQVLPRLETETVTDPELGTTVTAYAYDAANNRASKTVQGGSEPGFWQYDYNAANQLVSWRKLAGPWGTLLKEATLGYDANGNRSEQRVTDVATLTAAVTQYSWDAQDRLSAVEMPDGQVHGYEYDYRTRRMGISRTGGQQGGVGTVTAVVFSGGLSLAEWETTGNSEPGTENPPSVHYTRGPDMGGGVGGLLYSRRGETLKYNLGNGRGDIVAQGNAQGELTWTASYEAYGKRTKETGENADKQRANTKDEDPTGLLNEGFRYRDLETGVWLSRDPAGFVDGPNLYAYVMQNPWTHWDPDGLRVPTNQKEAKSVADCIGRQSQNLERLTQRRDDASWRAEHYKGTALGKRFAEQAKDLSAKIVATAKDIDYHSKSLGIYCSAVENGDMGIAEHANFCEKNCGKYYEPGMHETTFDLMGMGMNAAALKGLVSAASGVLAKFGATEGVSGMAVTANFAQSTFRESFSKAGASELSKIAGAPIKSIDDLVAALKSGTITPAQIPVNFIQNGRNTLMLNTRTAQALERAGIPRSQWNAVDQSGSQMFQQMGADQIKRNQLTPAGTPMAFPGMKTTSQQLPISQSGCGNTRLTSDAVSLTIEFEYRETGRDLIGCLRFSDVIAYTFRNEMHSQGYLSEAYDAVHEVPESSWLQQMKDAAPNGVRDAHSKRHFAVFLSSNGYFEVLAGSYVFEALREGFLE